MTDRRRSWARVVGGARRAVSRGKGLKLRFDHTHAGRALKRFSVQNGNVLAGGVAYYSVASIAAGFVLAVTVASAVVGGSPRYRQAFFAFIANSLPGVITTDSQKGLVDPSALSPTPVTGVVGAIALVVLANTATRFFSGLRAAELTMLGRGAGSPLKGKLRDFAALIGLVVIVLIGAGLQIAASRAARVIAGALGEGGVPEWAVRSSALLAGFVTDALFVALVLLVLGRSRVSARVLLPTIAGTALVIGVLRALSSLLVGGAASNAVLAPFAAIITILVFVDFVSRVLLLSGAWIGAVSNPDEDTSALVALPSPARRARGTVTTKRAVGKTRGG